MKAHTALGVLLASLALAVTSCSDDPTIIETTPPPLILREVVPDSVNIGTDGPFNVSMRFNRVVDLDEIIVVPVPPADSTGDLVKTGSGIFVTWFDFVSRAGYGSQRLLIDGRYMEQPVVHEWLTNDSPPWPCSAGSSPAKTRPG